MGRIGFDNDKYLREQARYILERVENSDGKLYVECGGKLLFDYHASRVLPGFEPSVKMRVFESLKDKIDVIICIYAGDIERRKMRSDFGISYDSDVFKMIDDFSRYGLKCDKVVITRYENQPAAMLFKQKIESKGISCYSGKLATCLNQMYHEYRMGRKCSYSKFETFPVWNLPLDHPVNIAYEAATADIGDVNLIDHFHLSAYGKIAVNYSRDLEAFPLLKRIYERITGTDCPYKSPTDMGVNRIGFGIVDDEVCREAGRQEIIRRYLVTKVQYAQGMRVSTPQRVGMTLISLRKGCRRKRHSR